MRMLSLCTALSLGVFLAACGGDDDACANVTCSDHGTCVADGDTATCECDAGYHADALTCVDDAAAFTGSCELSMTGGSACIAFGPSYDEETAQELCTAAGTQPDLADLDLTATLSSDACSAEGADVGTCTIVNIGVVIYFYEEPAEPAGISQGMCTTYAGTFETP